MTMRFLAYVYVTLLAILSTNLQLGASVRILAENAPVIPNGERPGAAAAPAPPLPLANLPANNPAPLLPTSLPANTPAPIPPASVPGNTAASLPANIPANLPGNVPPEMLANVPPETLANLPANVTPEMLANVPPEALANLPANVPPEALANVPPEMLANLPATMLGQLPANVPPEVLAGLSAGKQPQQGQPGADESAASGDVAADLPAIPKMPDFSGLTDLSFPPMPSAKMPQLPHNITLFGFEVPIPKFINNIVDGEHT